MNDFYVTLPSSVKNPQFNNTSSRYVTRLPQVLRLEKDKYSVAVTDIIYPYSFTNVSRSLNYWIHFKNREPICLTFPAAQYNSVDEIVETLNAEPVRIKRSTSPNPDEPRAKRSIKDKLDNINKEKEEDEKKGKSVIVKAKGVLGQAADAAEEAQEEIDNAKKVLDQAEKAEEGARGQVADVITVIEQAEDDANQAEKLVGNVNEVHAGAAGASGSVRAKVEAVQDGAAAVAGTVQAKVGGVLGEAATAEATDSQGGKDLPSGTGHRQQQSQQEESKPQSTNMPGGRASQAQRGASNPAGDGTSQQFQPAHPERIERPQEPPEAPAEQGAVPTRTQIHPSSNQQKLSVIRQQKFARILEMTRRGEADRQARISKHWQMRKKWSEIMKAGSKYHQVALDIYKKPDDKNQYEDLKDELVRIRSTVRVTDVESASRYLKFSNTLDYMEIEFMDDNILFVEFEPSCSYFLGFHDPIIRESCIAPSKVDFFGNVSTIYLYCDIVDPIIVGDQKNSLLSVIPCKGKYGEMVHHTIPYPRYLPIMNNTIDSVKVEFLSEFAEPINFNWGSTIIVLHFKKED